MVPQPLPLSDYLSDIWKPNLFANTTVFCTGGSGTICSAQVRALVHLGANACIVGRNTQKVEDMAESIKTARQGSKILGIGGVDVREIESLQEAVEKCVSELGGIDLVIAGAAGNFLSPLSGLSANAFKSVIDIDLLGSFNTFKATIPHLLHSHLLDSPRATGQRLPSPNLTPSILFISATFHYTSFPTQAHASAAKAGVDALSANIAVEYGPLGIRSNILAPGPIEGTEGMKRLSIPGREQEMTSRVPLGRWGTVREIADATIWVMGEGARFVNGTGVVVDGGAWRTQTYVDYPGGLADAVKSEKSKL
ncbi:MAG: hypothetical protein M1834_009175 [Cirrosporium novae-zelandiae]|nr:MAG: hypothetical protein M1834_009175 [Cirrosporium novae-zelandiae]